ncbi:MULTISPECIES: hypothetical protein [Bacillus cereus group]|uniref:Uncharacterized protein n=2 Tax=Bacillus cereus group TaxID=86661 RepID=A0A9X7ATG0_BACTU|nr:MULTISPECIES: hypothetical protein [Bacillus cereus group]EKS7858126.1 hypothetical protein [Bacillus cereus]EOO11472.1 hypothetical protein IGA_05748 [Bacillus cereus HuA3-9]PFT50733.1 hypothetical protein COK72_01580 [Bacillus thuringiensis]PFY22770.1 hypothetical protein COL44_17900 [Bacillus toyonensis]
MATPFSEIYKLFLGKIDSYDFAKLTKEELEEDLKDYLDLAISNFIVCTKDLEDMTDEGFNEKLTMKEKDILATLMVLEFLKPKMATDELIIQALTDKDIRMTSQANHLKLVMELSKQIERRVQTAMNSYAIRNTEDKAK